MKSVPILLVYWLDAEAHAGWTPPEDIDHDGRPVPSIGFEVKRTSERLYLATSWDAHNHNFNPVISIPLAWILSELTLGQLSLDSSEGRFELKHHRLKKRDLSFSTET
jgi:hypothetical protein